MKLNNLQKNLFTLFSVSFSILIATLLWKSINLPLNNISGTKGFLVLQNYNPINDTLRYIFFITLPLITYLFLNQKLNKKTLQIKELIFEKEKKIKNYHPPLIIISVIFIIFIFFEFFSISFSFKNYKLDHFHDGNFLTPFQNYLFTKKIWTSSQLIHGGSDVFYPYLMWKIFGTHSIGASRTFPIFLILFLKLLSVLLSYQLTKITNLNRDTKILFFTILTTIILSMSTYTFLGAGYYLSHKDIYIILFLIFFIELFFNSKLKYLSIFLICSIATISLLLQIDRGSYINFILIFYFIYSLLSKKYKESIFILLFFLICWIFAINIIGFDEFKTFLQNTKTMFLTGELMLGLKYPEPFFSMSDDSNGARATRALLLQITAGLFVLNYIISNKNKLFNSKKILFLFLFLLSLIIFKNALGRSDSSHIRGVHDLPILINFIFILSYSLIFVEKKFLKKKISSNKIFNTLSILFLLFYYISNHHYYKFENVKNFNKNFINFLKLEDKVFLDKKTSELINYYKKISKKDNCVENITYDDAIPYLLKKPTCTKYWASWQASPVAIQKDYIYEIKKNQPNYILYFSGDHEFEELGIYERIKLVETYILSNYEKYNELNDYIILKKK